jgi:hypothetical protein
MSSSSVSNDHNQGLLDLLQAHGEQFLNNFDLPKSNSKKRKHLDEDTPPENSNTPTHFGSESEEEWGGIVTDMGDEEVDASDGEGILFCFFYGQTALPTNAKKVQNFKHGDDESTADTTTFSPSPNVVVFSGYSSKRETPALSNKSLRKSFMVAMFYYNSVYIHLACFLVFKSFKDFARSSWSSTSKKTKLRQY